MFHRRRSVSEDTNLIEKGPILTGISFVDRLNFVRNSIDFDIADPGHQNILSSEFKGDIYFIAEIHIQLKKLRACSMYAFCSNVHPVRIT